MSFRVRARYKPDDASAVMATSVKVRYLPVYVAPETGEHFIQIPVAAFAAIVVRSRFLKWGVAGDPVKKQIYEKGDIVRMGFTKSDLRRLKRRP